MQTIRQPVQAEFDAVNRLIIDNLASDVAMIEDIGHYIVDAGGKRLRPLVALLSARSCGYQGEDHIKFAAIVEFIHTATLLHDDVVDISTLRRGRPTANAEFGIAASVLVGDFLYTRAFQLMVELGNTDVLQIMAATTNTIAEGEVLQLARAGDASTTEAQYLDVVTRKTAILFAAACQGAGAIAGVDENTLRSLHEFGLNTGIAFQIIDDVLDYTGNPLEMGKNAGDDLSEGKPTLPLIHIMQAGSEQQRRLVAQAITGRNARQIDAITEAVQSSGALDHADAVAQGFKAKALAALQKLRHSEFRHAMEEVAAVSVHRTR